MVAVIYRFFFTSHVVGSEPRPRKRKPGTIFRLARLPGRGRTAHDHRSGARGEIARGSAFGATEIGAAIEAVRLEQYGGGLFRHVVFGLGAGDILVITSDPKRPVVDIPNVLFASKKVRGICELTVVEPEHC